MELNVQLEKPSSITRKLTIKVPASVVTKHFERGLAEVQKHAKLKGFRPGQVPISMVRQFYGEDVRHRAFQNIVEDSFREAIREHKVNAVGRPQIEADESAAQEGKELTFTATVEVMPEIEVKSYTGVALTEGKSEVVDADVDGLLKNFQESQAELIPVAGGLAMADGTQSSRPANKGDFVDMTFNGGVVKDGKVEERAGMKGTRMIEIGSGGLIPGFEDQLVGMRKSETKTFRVEFPKDYDAEVAGQEAEFTVTVNEIKEKKFPEMNDEFAKQAGYESLEDMRTKAREHLVARKKEEVDRKLRSDLLQALIDKNPFEVPSVLIQAQTRALAQDVAQNMKQQGFNDQMVQQALAGEMDGLKQKAESQVRASLILEEIAKKESITVSTDEMNSEIKKVAEYMRRDEAQMQEFYEKNPDRRADLEFRLREEKTVKFLIEKAKVKKEK